MSGRLLDLFCGAGAASEGYARAGFEVTGVDIQPQPRIEHAFIQADVFGLPDDFLRSFDAIHASPPCQGYTSMRHAPGAKGAPLWIGRVRDLLKGVGRPFVIENVEGARSHLHDPVCLCGSHFGLGALGYQLRRHRLFETSFYVAQPTCAHTTPVIGVYGGHVRCRSARHGGRRSVDLESFDRPALARLAMGIGGDMTMSEMSQAIPPAYTEHIGRHLIEHLGI